MNFTSIACKIRIFSSCLSPHPAPPAKNMSACCFFSPFFSVHYEACPNEFLAVFGWMYWYNHTLAFSSTQFWVYFGVWHTQLSWLEYMLQHTFISAELNMSYPFSSYYGAVHKWQHFWGEGVSQTVTKSDGGGGRFGLFSKPKVTSFMDSPLEPSVCNSLPEEFAQP